MRKNTPTVMALTIIISAGLALAFVKLNIVEAGSQRSAYTAALAGALIGAALFLLAPRVVPPILQRGMLSSRRNLVIVLAAAFSVVPVAVIGSFMDLWGRPFFTALGWALLIAVIYGIMFWTVLRFMGFTRQRQ